MNKISPNKYSSVELTSRGPLLKHHTLPAKLAPNTLIIKPFFVGICRSDIKEAAGERSMRRDFGHEIVGEILWTNAPTPLSQGDIVLYDPNVPITRGSGFSEVVVATGSPANLRRAFYKIRQTANYRKMVFAEPMACAAHCISQLLLHMRKQNLNNIAIAVVGAGNAGTLIGLLAKYYGAAVTLYNRTEDRLDFLSKKSLFVNKELRTLNSNTGGTYNVVIPATSFLFPTVLKQSIKMLKGKGLLLLYGGTKQSDILEHSNINIDVIRRHEKLKKIVYRAKEFYIGGTYGTTINDFQKAINLLQNEAKYFPVERLIIEEIPLRSLPKKLFLLIKHDAPGKIIVNLREN